MALLNLIADSVKLTSDIFVNLVVVINTDNGLVCRNFDNVERVNLPELVLLGHRRTRHTGELLVQSKEILKSDSREGFALVVDFNAFLSLDSLMQTLIIAASEHQSAGKFIDDNNLVAAALFRGTNNVVDVALHNAVCADSLIDMVKKRDIFGVHKVLNAEIFLRFCNAVRKEVAGFRLFVDEVIAVELIVVFFLCINLDDCVFDKRFRKLVGFLVHIGGGIAVPRDDERRSRFVNED